MKIFAIIIVVLVGLIVGTVFLMPNKTENIENGHTDFSFIGVPTITPEPSFTDLLTSTPDSMQKTVLDNVYLDEYYVYPCEMNGVTSNALVLVTKSKPDATGMNSFAEAEKAIRSYENAIYKDWGHIIYKETYNPNLSTVNFSDESINDETVWAEKYRVGNLSDNTTKIYYGWALNYLIVAASKECLLETMRSMYPVH